MGYYDYGGWAPYVSVAERKAKALKEIASAEKKGKSFNPVVINGRNIANTFWGKAWCQNLEAYSDYVNRLPRGRTYARNGSVIDLQITKGKVVAKVMGSSLYKIEIAIKSMPEVKWKSLVKSCSGKIDSLIELLQGKFSKSVMEVITQKDVGLFPNPKEISLKCSCPDSASMCKHIAAVLYGVGAMLDSKPEWLFTLRHVDHVDLIASVGKGSALAKDKIGEATIEDNELSALFGIEMDIGKTALTKEKKSTTKKSIIEPKTSVKKTIPKMVLEPTVKTKSQKKILTDKIQLKTEIKPSPKKTSPKKPSPKKPKAKISVDAKNTPEIITIEKKRIIKKNKF